MTKAQITKFWSYVNKSNGCWIWTGSFKTKGYGQIMFNRKNWLSHRVSYLITYGNLPPLLDHKCNNKACVNPTHLVPATHQENILRGTAPTAINARKSHCKRGHRFVPENLCNRDYGRECRLCRNLVQKEWRAKKKLKSLKD